MKKILFLLICAGAAVTVWTETQDHQHQARLMFANTRTQAQLGPFKESESSSEPMTLERLEDILRSEVGQLQTEQGQFQFEFEGRPMLILTNQEHNRMRIISPVTPEGQLTPEQRDAMLSANFHSALDARYAISNGTVFAAFLHPLSSLEENDLRSALRQVSQLVANFGSTYSSGGLQFGPGNEDPTPLPSI